MHKSLLPFIFLIGVFVFQAPESNAQDLHRQNEDLPCVNKNFNTVVHVAIDSLFRQPIITEDEVDSLLARTSEFFSPICMSFTMCEYNVISDNYSYNHILDRPQSVFDRFKKMDVLYGKDRRINIYIVDSIQNIYCGYGELNGITTTKNANVWIGLKDCIDPDPAQNLGHQLGHLFGLLDTYDKSTDLELANGDNCEEAGDLICDTPADPFGSVIVVDGDTTYLPAAAYVDKCEFKSAITDMNDQVYQPDVGNLMSGYPCKCGFTREQYIKMAELYLASPVKQY